MTIIMMIILMMIFVGDVTWSNSEVEAMKRMLVTDSKHWKKFRIFFSLEKCKFWWPNLQPKIATGPMFL